MPAPAANAFKFLHFSARDRLKRMAGLSQAVAPVPSTIPRLAAFDCVRLTFRAGVLVGLLATAGGARAQPTALPEYEQAFHRGDYARAKALAEQRLAVAPGDVAARILAARADAAQGRFDAAYDGFRAALAREPKNPDALYYLGVTASVLAQVELDRLVATAPESARAHQVRARGHEAAGRKAEAEAEYQAALAAGPESVEVLVALGELKRTAMSFDEAASYYARALEIAPSSYAALYGLGACRVYEQRHQEAAALFRRAVSVDPQAAAARLALGIALLQTGRAGEALPELREAVRLEPAMRQAYYQLGRTYQALGRGNEAQAAFSRADDLLEQERKLGRAMLGDGPPTP
jgi:tetratricopeptide (TPR) repeat protein